MKWNRTICLSPSPLSVPLTVDIRLGVYVCLFVYGQTAHYSQLNTGRTRISDVDDDRTNARWKRRKQTVHMCKTHCAPRYYCRFFCLLHTCAAAMWEQTVYNKCVYRKQKTVSAKKKFINKWKTERNWDCSQCLHTPSTNTHTSTRRSLRSAIWKIAPKNHTCSFSIFLFSFCNGFFSSSFSDWFVVCFFFTINVDRCLLDCLLVLFWSSIYVTTKRIFTDFFGLYFFFWFFLREWNL